MGLGVGQAPASGQRLAARRLGYICCVRVAVLLPAALPKGPAQSPVVPVKRSLDPAMSSTFHMDWLVPLDQTTQDDYTRAVAEKADVILRSGQFLGIQHETTGTDLEVRVWVEAALANACVSITWEPGEQRFGFYLLDESLRERLACVVFHEIPCIEGEQSELQADRILAAALEAVRNAAEGADALDHAQALRDSMRSVRIPVLEGPRPDAAGGADDA